MKKVWQKLQNRGGEHLLFMAATIFTSGIHFLYSIYVKAYVSPLEYGIYSTCMLLQTYMAYLQMGVLSAFNRDYPQLIGARKIGEAKQYSDTVFSFLLVVYTSSTALAIAVFLTIGKAAQMDTKLWVGFILAAIISTVTIVENFGNYKCRIEKGFFYSSIVMLVELVSVILGLFLVPLFGYYAIYFTSLISFLIGIAMYSRSSYRGFRFGIDKKILWTILTSGLPLLVNGLIWTVVNSIDKFVILGFIDMEALGMYGIAQNAFSYMILIPSSMSQLFYVQMGKAYGATQKEEALVVTSAKYATLLAGITSLVALIAYFFLPVLVSALMPSYEGGVAAAQILILGLSIYAATLINGNILTILRKNKALLFNSICMCIFNAICSVLFVYITGRKIESVALGTAVSYIFCAFILIFQVQKHTGCKLSLLFQSAVLPVCVSMVPCVICYELFQSRVAGFAIAAVLIGMYYVICYRKLLWEMIKEIK